MYLAMSHVRLGVIWLGDKGPVSSASDHGLGMTPYWHIGAIMCATRVASDDALVECLDCMYHIGQPRDQSLWPLDLGRGR